MGNRACITTESNFNNDGIGVYVHWNGSVESVNAFLKYCELKGYREPDTDNYGWARLCQVIGNFFGGECSVGIDVCSHLDCDNYDNGTFFIKGWKIVGGIYNEPYRRTPTYTPNELYDRLCEIDSCMPIKEQIGEDNIKIMLTKERCRDCVCLVEDEQGNWICDEMEQHCKHVVVCPEGI